MKYQCNVLPSKADIKHYYNLLHTKECVDCKLLYDKNGSYMSVHGLIMCKLSPRIKSILRANKNDINLGFTYTQVNAINLIALAYEGQTTIKDQVLVDEFDQILEQIQAVRSIYLKL